MDLITYNNIIQFIQNYKGLMVNCLQELKMDYPSISHNTMYSILSIEYQRRMKRNHIKSNSQINKYWKVYQSAISNGDSPGIILRMSEEFDVSPCLIAKLILKKYIEEYKGPKKMNFNVNRYLRDSYSIPDMDLAYEIYLCTLYDNLYSPIADIMKHSLGQQYEFLLQKQVIELGLAFHNEEYLRKCGYDKTPDIKLEVPVAIDDVVVNWIESKALFGDEFVHKGYMNNQYLSYWNRFGPGLVIYWFGYLETIVDDIDMRFIVRDHLPKNIVFIS